MSHEYKIICGKCEAPIDHVCKRRRPYRGHGEDEAPGGEEWVPNGMGTVYHENTLVNALIDLLIWKPEGGLPDATVAAMKASDWYDEGDEDEPFCSQSIIYSLTDCKSNGRSFFSHLRQIAEAAGFDWRAIESLAYKAKRIEDHDGAITRGGLVGHTMLESIDWRPQPGWTVDMTAEGVGRIRATVKRTRDDARRGGMRGDWDWWVHFEGGGRCFAGRLLRIAHSIRDDEGVQVWPLEAGPIDLDEAE